MKKTLKIFAAGIFSLIIMAGVVQPGIIVQAGNDINGMFIEPIDGVVGLEVDLTPQFGSNGKFIAPIEAPLDGSVAISTRAEMEAIKNDLNGKYHLINDIDLSGSDWVPLGDDQIKFTGIFDGQGHVVKNMTITGEDFEDNGLFGYAVDAVIVNVGMENTNINSNRSSSETYAGGICGYISSLQSSSIINNCYNTGTISASSSDNYLGGICGGMGYESDISNCYNTSDITAASLLYAFAGGICGYADSAISNCFNTGDVMADSSVYCEVYGGGICGNSYYLFINNCYNTGDVTVNAYSSSYGGGICGYIRSFYSSTPSIISNCYNTGNLIVSSTWNVYAGGICGYADVLISNCYNEGDINASCLSSEANAGGICGVSSLVISNCYNEGAVTASSSSYSAFAGGICGCIKIQASDFYSINNCYNTGDITASSLSSSFSFSCAGGILGYANLGLFTTSISNCCNTGAVAASSSYYYYLYAGGICGYSDVFISNCYNKGDVNVYSSNSYDFAGGICGYSFSASINNCYNMGNVTASGGAGGICSASESSINNCYNNGSVTAYRHAGGICASTYGTISNCYNTGTLTASSDDDVSIGGIYGYNQDEESIAINSYCLELYDNTFGTQLTSDQMKNEASFTGFDFDDVWGIDPSINNGYPHLQVFDYSNLNKILYGDVNGDGLIEINDLTLLRRHFANWQNITLSPGADVNGDSKIEINDLTILRRYFANWSGITLGPTF